MDADDTVPFCAGSNSKVIQDNLNQGLNTFGEWLKVNSLFLNTTTTEAMLFGTNSKLSKHKDFDLTFHGQSLKRVNMFTYLGIIFDETTSWAPYIQYILPKVGKRLGMLSRLQRDLTCHAANTLYLSLIHPIFDYATLYGTVLEWAMPDCWIIFKEGHPKLFQDLWIVTKL